MSVTGYDFCGWATKNDLKCADGRVIRHGAFSVNDGKKVPLVWNHQHNSPDCVLGHAILENRDDGVFAYGFFNNTKQGQDAKEQVMHGDVEALSIWANNLQQIGSDVMHGVIREVSLVLSGANPGAFIESIAHSSEPIEEWEEEGIFYTDEGLMLEHSEPIQTEEKVETEDSEVEEAEEEESTEELSHSDEGDKKMADSKDRTVQDVLDTMNEEQKTVMYALIGAAIEDAKGGKSNNIEHSMEDSDMKFNLFEGEAADQKGTFLSHSDMETIIKNAAKSGSLRDAFEAYTDGATLAHGIDIDTTGMETAQGSSTYGFNDPDMLFPEYKSINGTAPEWLSRRMEWVDVVLRGVKRVPFSRVKSTYANITEDAARAKGYIKGNQKVSEVFSTLKRTTSPQTIYKLQKMDRDDIIDITDFDVVAWIKAEMRVMLDEEIARAILIGDGRLPDAEDKISEEHVRPIASDVPLFTIKYGVVGERNSDGVLTTATVKQFMDDVIRARKAYRGSGNPIMFTTEDILTEMILLKDDIGHRLYASQAELATALRVSKIVTVEPMEGHKIVINNEPKDLLAVIINLTDYTVGADKGGAISLFDDFDIDFNKYTYLIETRISGAMNKPFSAISMYLDGE